MIRTFHPIGQGAFYTERFGDFTMVYDCGSSSGLDIIVNEIQATFGKGEKIDLLFVSHFHEDHINGIDFLLDHCRIENIVLPLMELSDKTFTILDNCYTSYEDYRLILDPESFVDNRAENIIYVIPDSGRIDKEISILDLKDINKISSCTKISITGKGPGWHFIPFNFRHNTRAKELENKLKSKGITVGSVNEFLECWKYKDIKKSMINCYREIKGDMNTNSLTLYSGPKSHEIKAGCLYLGDYNTNGETKYNNLKDAYENVCSNIEFIQIPHHGSRHNFNLGLLDLCSQPIRYIISAGSSNKYKHPHSIVIKELAVRQLDFFWISEHSSSSVSEDYNNIHI